MYVVQEFLVNEEISYINETYFHDMTSGLRFRNFINKYDKLINAKLMMIEFDKEGKIQLEEILLKE